MHPMLATPGRPPAGPGWQFEVKWDGIRCLADTQGGGLKLSSRSGRDMTVSFPELAEIGDAAQDAVLDGEIIALRDGVPSFSALAERMHVRDRRRAAELARSQPVVVMVFDLLRLYGVELTARPWSERRSSLSKLDLPAPTWQLSPVYDDGPSLLAATAERGLEGIVAKRTSARYQPGRRSADWVKTAHRHHQACVIGGWRPETGSAERVGALLIGVADHAANTTIFAGRVGAALSGAAERSLRAELAELARPVSPFADPVPEADADTARWVQPTLVVEVSHLGWTSGGRLRQPVLRGRRTDLSAKDVTREP